MVREVAKATNREIDYNFLFDESSTVLMFYILASAFYMLCGLN